MVCETHGRTRRTCVCVCVVHQRSEGEQQVMQAAARKKKTGSHEREQSDGEKWPKSITEKTAYPKDMTAGTTCAVGKTGAEVRADAGAPAFRVRSLVCARQRHLPRR